MDWFKNIFLKQGFSEDTEAVNLLSEWCTHEDISFWTSNDEAYNLLMKDLKLLKDITLEDILEKSDSFPVKFPIETPRCKELQNYVSKEILERNVNSAYPVIHEKVLQLIAKFLLHKTGPSGSRIENRLYDGMDIPTFIDRLLTKRAVTFVGPHDVYVLSNGMKGNGKWETIGTENERSPLLLEHCLSYDEIKISALVSVSSYTYYLNKGNRLNQGVYSGERENIEEEGIIIGLIGPRFQRQNVMDYQDIIHDGININKNIFLDMYGEKVIKYEILTRKRPVTLNRFVECKPGLFFDNFIYEKRIALSFDTLLYEANSRAEEKGTFAFVHIVGIGLGVWKVSGHQDQLFVNTCARRIEYLGKHLLNVSDVCFAHIKASEDNSYKNGDVIPIEAHPKGGIKLHLVNREPHEKMTAENQGKLLVVSFAWDGNALPGNEFWVGSLYTSSDPAAASSTQIAELHNAHINPKVCGMNLRIVTSYGILTLKEYQEKVKNAKGHNKLM